MRKIVIFAFAAVCLALPVSADYFQPSHSCYKPYKPIQFSNDWERRNFLSDVETYRMCIEQFVDEQRAAAQRHLNAADEAINEWNMFIQFELN